MLGALLLKVVTKALILKYIISGFRERNPNYFSVLGSQEIYDIFTLTARFSKIKAKETFPFSLLLNMHKGGFSVLGHQTATTEVEHHKPRM